MDSPQTPGLFSKIAARDPFSNEDRRARIDEHFSAISDDVLRQQDETVLYRRAVGACSMGLAALAETPNVTVEKHSENLSEDVAKFSYTMRGNYEVYLNKMGIVPQALPSHRVEGDQIVFTYPAIGDPQAVAAKHADDIEAIRIAISATNKAIAQYNGMAETEIRSRLADARERAKRRFEFLQHLE